jgi:hypothetical protein
MKSKMVNLFESKFERFHISESLILSSELLEPECLCLIKKKQIN